MNYSYLRYLFGRALQIFSGLLLFPFLLCLFYAEPAVNRFGFLTAFFLSLIPGLFLTRKKPTSKRMTIQEGMVLSALLWLIFSLLGSLPLLISKAYPSFVDSFFEVASALTGTGFSSVEETEELARSILFWRSFCQWIGGLGVLIFTLSQIPRLFPVSFDSSPADGGESKIKEWLKIAFHSSSFIYTIYFLFTLALFLILLRKMPVFDAFCQTFATAGTGTFSTSRAREVVLGSMFLRWILIFFMILFSINFQLYYRFFVRREKNAIQDEELRWLLGAVMFSFAALMLMMKKNGGSYPLAASLGNQITDSAFAIFSMVSTTGSSTSLFQSWPTFAQAILLLLMFMGGSSGSLASGFKVCRIGMKIKLAYHELIVQRKPSRIYVARFNGHPIGDKKRRVLQGYGVAHGLTLIILFLMIAWEGASLEQALFSSVSVLSNVGPGLCPVESFAGFSPLSKIILSLAMIAGRLEIWPVIMIFSPKTWSKY